MSLRLATWILALALAGGCHRTSFESPTGSSQAPEETQATPQGQTSPDPTRPTDSTEGVVGYLTDPKLLTIESQGGDRRVVRGAAGAVAAERGDLRELAIGVFETSASLDQQSVTRGALAVDATSVGCARPSADGSFAVELTRRGGRLIVTTSAACDATKVVVSTDAGGRLRAAVADAGDTAFGSLLAEFDASCLCPAGEVFYERTRECMKPFDECPPSLYPSGEVCGCDGKTHASVCAAKAASVIRYTLGRCAD